MSHYTISPYKLKLQEENSFTSIATVAAINIMTLLGSIYLSIYLV